jgi:hypothetical protein
LTFKFNATEFSRDLKILKKQTHFKMLFRRITKEMTDRVNGFNMDDENGLGQMEKK